MKKQSDHEKVQRKLMEMHRLKAVVSPKGNPVLANRMVAPKLYDGISQNKSPKANTRPLLDSSPIRSFEPNST